MSIESIYWKLTENYNQELNTSIRLIEVEGGCRPPEATIETQEVAFCLHYDKLIQLFNGFTAHPAEGSPVIHHFLLYHQALRKRLYREAHLLLEKLQKELEALRAVISTEEQQSLRLFAQYQTLFVLVHEFSHIFYAQRSDLLAINQDSLKQDLIWLRKELDASPYWWFKLARWVIPRLAWTQTHSFDEVIATPSLQEELLCDDAAWRMMHNMIQAYPADEEGRATISAYVVFSLYYLELQRTLESMYLSANSQPLQKDLMYYTTRSTVLVNRAWDDVPAIECYKSLVNRLTRKGRFSLMCSLRTSADDIDYIRSSPKGKYNLQEEQQLAEMYNDILHE